MSQSKLNPEQWDLLFGVNLSIRYHNRRKAFYKLLDRLVNVINVLMGTTIFATFAKLIDAQLAAYAAATITIVTAVNLVMSFGDMAHLHTNLRNRFIDLDASITPLIDAEDIKRQRLNIEKDEPATLKTLSQLCYNEVVDMFYERDQVDELYLKVSPLRRYTAQLF